MRLKPANRGLLTAFFSSLLASIFCVSSYADTSNLQEVPAQFSYQNGTITITNSSGSVDLSNGLVLSFNYGANVDSFWEARGWDGNKLLKDKAIAIN
ncbi:MAG: hypothetical protein HWD59_05565 [Coxiellaceae bacterium]|nr:MAG: hypothetical protein HWD59_05565 [Coxiellaceae bacterium]